MEGRPKFRLIKALLLCTTVIATPTLAQADPATLVGLAVTAAASAASAAIGSAVLGALVSAAISIGGSFLIQALFGQSLDQQVKSRTRDFDPHPPFRFAFGEFPQDGTAIFHYVHEKTYYVVYLLSSIPIQEITRVVIQEHIDLQVVEELGSRIYDMSDPAPNPSVSSLWNEDDFLLWVGKGDHTTIPQVWLDEIGPSGTKDQVLLDTDKWLGVAVAFCRFSLGSSASYQAQRLAYGSPPPLKWFGRWSKLYDPRKDPNSGVTQYVSGSHDPDDATTWEYSSNPALCGLTLAFHEYALGFDREMIPIQQWADAADACDTYYSSDASTSGSDEVISDYTDTYKYKAETPPSTADYSAADYDDSTWPTGQGYFSSNAPSGDNNTFVQNGVDYSVWLRTSVSGGFVNRDIRIDTFQDDNARLWVDGVEQTLSHSTAGNGTVTVAATGAERVIAFKVVDTSGVAPGNGITAGLQVTALSSDLWGCHGLVTIEERELSLLDPVLATMAGHLDTTDGLLGVRAGVWVAPTDTLSQPVGDDVAVNGARDAGFDTVRAKFIWAGNDWQETDGPGYHLREGSRVHPFSLPLVASREQAGKLEQILGKRAEPNRTITATWDGREFNRRIGERVNAGVSGFGRATSTYVITGKRPNSRAVQGGFDLSVDMTLVEDLEATYSPGAYTAPDEFAGAPPTPGELTAPTVVIEQIDYYDGSEVVARIKVTVTVSAATAELYDAIRLASSDGGDYEYWKTDEEVEGETTHIYYFEPVVVGLTYIIRARAKSDHYSASPWGYSNSLTIETPATLFAHPEFSPEFA